MTKVQTETVAKPKTKAKKAADLFAGAGGLSPNDARSCPLLLAAKLFEGAED